VIGRGRDIQTHARREALSGRLIPQKTIRRRTISLFFLRMKEWEPPEEATADRFKRGGQVKAPPG